MNWLSIINNESGQLLLTTGLHSVSVITQHSIVRIYAYFMTKSHVLWMRILGVWDGVFFKFLFYTNDCSARKHHTPSHSSGCDLWTLNPFSLIPHIFSKLQRHQLQSLTA